MRIDGVSRIVLLGEPRSGVKTFVSAFVEAFSRSIYVGKTRVSLNTFGRNAARLDSVQALEAQAETAYFATSVISPMQAFSKDISGFQNEFEFQIKVNTELCGRIKLMNILGRIDDIKSEVSRYGISMVVIVVDGHRLMDESSSYNMSGMLTKLKTISQKQPYDYPFRVIFVVSKADLFGVENTGKQEFFESRCGCCRELIEFCRHERIKYEFIAFSAANRDTSKVFDKFGKLLSKPDFEPWNVDCAGLTIISRSIPVLKYHYRAEAEECMYSIGMNRGRFNSDSLRSFVEVQQSRSHLADAIKYQYQLDRFENYSTPMEEYLKGKTFVINPV